MNNIEKLEEIRANYIRTVLNKKSQIPVTLATSSHLIILAQNITDIFIKQQDQIDKLEKDIKKLKSKLEKDKEKKNG